ncbi:MAG: hypothetical protein FJY76_01915 [Candidatus Aenigmarchaeota archaeon]|nr:hypothetical protein [Candidatus Aenigmarchaeota archaeon]
MKKMLIVLSRGDDEARELYPKLLQMAAAKLASGHFQVAIFLLGDSRFLTHEAFNAAGYTGTLDHLLKNRAEVFCPRQWPKGCIEGLQAVPIDRLPDLMLDADVCIQM